MNVLQMFGKQTCTFQVYVFNLVFPANCPPGNLTASLDCASNQALVSWNANPSFNSITATMMDESNGLLSCSSSTTSCKVPSLKCGQFYTVTATYFDGNCSSVPSDPIYMQSGRYNLCSMRLEYFLIYMSCIQFSLSVA